MAEEIDVFLKEINAELPCGEDLEYDPDFIALEQAIQGKPEQQIGDVIQEAEPPNWKVVRKLAEQLLTRTRDLRVLICYLRALIALKGISGLVIGLELLQKLIENFWQNIYPQLDPDDNNDPTERVNILMSLCDFDTFLKPLKKMPLVDSRSFGKFSLWDIHLAEGIISSNDPEIKIPELSSIDGAFQDCDVEQLKSNAKALTDSLQYLDKLEEFVTDQVGIDNAPNFSDLRKLLTEIDDAFSKQIAQQNNIKELVDESKNEPEITASPINFPVENVSNSAQISAIRNNDDVVKTLNLICDYYRVHEPSSPVPILLERAIRLTGKNFMEIMKDMAPEGVEQVEFLRGTPSDAPNNIESHSSSEAGNSSESDYNY